MGFTSFFNKVWRGAKDVVEKVAGGVKDAVSTGTKAVGTVYKDASTFFRDQQRGIFGTLNNAIGTAGDTVKSLGSSLSMPLVLGAAALGGILLLKK